MRIVNLDEDNIEEYTRYLTPDVAENIGRTFVRGMVACDDDTPIAGMVWEIKNMMLEAANESNIMWLKIDKDEAAEPLFENYKTAVKDDEVVKSNFSLPAKASDKEREALLKEGFTVKFMEGDLIKARLSEITELEFLKKIKLSENVHALNTITQRGFNSAARQFMAKGHFGVLEDLPYLSRSYFENDISCYSENEGQVDGLFLFHENPSGGLVIVVMAAIGSNYGKILPHMIKCSVTNMQEMYPPETEIWIDRHNYASLALSEKLFPRGFGIPVYVGSRDEV